MQLLQSSFGEITAYLLHQRGSWCTPQSLPYFCMPVNHRPWLQSKRKKNRPLRWDATGGYWTFCTRTMCQWGKSQKESRSHWRIWWTFGPGQEMVWSHLKVFKFSTDNPTGHSKRKKKKRQTQEEVGRQYQRVDWVDFASSARALENRTRWKGIVANSFVVPRWSSKVIK